MEPLSGYMQNHPLYKEDPVFFIWPKYVLFGTLLKFVAFKPAPKTRLRVSGLYTFWEDHFSGQQKV